ncbi:PCMD domain-containing protein [Parabacteroides distasonis]|uniref:PCMD domain-containing protein n=1 Tax=Parabacteroides distasonis TaxID=823 RepID=UPI001E42CBBC|nr:PCMD domain-containing protein [Parabacteroides distasonis]MDB9131519.1 PCMD domain-containing protein [Parabacteroides distasonis]
MTTPNCPITAYSYNTRSGTRPVSDIRIGANDNVAVWIITIGYGYGGNSSNPKAVTPSELFLGKYNEKGIEFASHPTGLHFWYKYHPFKGDLSDISISLFSGEQEIGKGILQEENEVSSYKDCILQIIYDEKYKHLSPDRISIVFKSGFNSEVESRESGSLTSSNTANPKFRGSELYIDDISLIYDK